MGGHRRLDQLFRKAQAKLTEAFAVACIGFHLARIAVIESGVVAAVVARFACMHLLGQRLELHRVWPVGNRIVLLLVEEFLAHRVDHARALFRAEHRVWVNLHALPGGRVAMSLVCHHCISRLTRVAPARHAMAMPSSDISRVRSNEHAAIGISGREDNRARKHDLIFAR
jgi:hypothetical protein